MSFFIDTKNYQMDARQAEDLSNLMLNINKYPLLSIEEQKELLRQYHVEKNQKAKEKLINHNLRLVMGVAIKFQRSSLPIEDLFQEGIFGLNKAIEKYDFKFNTALSTYAVIWISQHIRRAIIDKGSMIRTPVHYQEKLINTRTILKKLTKELNREPTVEELAAYLQISVSKAKKRLEEFYSNHNHVGTLDLEVNEEGGALVAILSNSDYDNIQLCSKQKDDDSSISMQVLNTILKDELEKFNDHNKLIFQLRYGFLTGEPMTYTQICHYFQTNLHQKISRQRVHQILLAGLQKLRFIFINDNQFTEDYL